MKNYETNFNRVSLKTSEKVAILVNFAHTLIENLCFSSFSPNFVRGSLKLLLKVDFGNMHVRKLHCIRQEQLVSEKFRVKGKAFLKFSKYKNRTNRVQLFNY